MDDPLVFWMAVGVGLGVVIASTWELVAILLLAFLSHGALDLPHGDIGGLGGRADEHKVFRLFVRTCLGCLIAALALYYLPIVERWSELRGHKDQGLILVTSGIVTVLIAGIVLWTNLIDRAIKIFVSNSKK